MEMGNKYIKSFFGALSVAVVLALSSTNANSALISLVEICGSGPGPGGCNDNDTVTLAGLTPVNKVDWDNISGVNPQVDGDLSVSIDGGGLEGTTGTWSYTGPASIQFLSLKFDGFTAVFSTNGETSGIWDTDLGPGEGIWFDDPLALIDGSCCLNNNGKPFAMSHIGVYVPVPAAVWLFGSGLLGLVGIARRRRV